LNGIIGVAVAAGQGSSFMEDTFKGLKFSVDWSFTLFIIGQCIFLLACIWHYLDSRSKS
ncbi:hypothetical protein BgiBS90_030077, partial [Biomphalaria glabrata]